MPENLMNPYVGPRAFQRQEKLYGRGREARQLFDLLTAERIILLHAPSGAGKTSLVQAALIPLLEAEEFFVPPVMRVNRLPASTDLPPETNRYVLSLLLCLDASLPEEAQSDEQQLAALSLDEYLKERQEMLTGGRNPVLVFDQFEECLTLDPYDPEAKHAFFAQVGTALRNRSRWALFSMRDDFVAGLEPYLRPLPTRLSNRFRLDLLDHASAAESIRQPAENIQVAFDPDAAANLIQDLSTVQAQRLDGSLENRVGPYVEPVQLQVVCRRLWSRLHEMGRLEDGISPEDVADMGAVSQALGGYYRDSVAAAAHATGLGERQIREWVGTQLITEQGIRGQVLQTANQSQGLKNQAIDLLVDAHLIRKEERRGALWYELAHDRLIDPVQSDNRLWREEHLSRLQMQAELWQKNRRDPTLLLTGESLQEAEVWEAAHRTEMTPLDFDFLLACQRNQTVLDVERQQQEMERQKREKELQEAKERAEAEQKLAASERKRAEAQARTATVLRRLAAALGVLVLVAIIASVLAVNESQNAKRAEASAQASALDAQSNAALAIQAQATSQANAELALTREAEALTSAEIAATAQAEAETNAEEAQTQRQLAEQSAVAAGQAQIEAEQAQIEAESLRLAVESRTNLSANSDLAILLAIEAVRLAPSQAAQDALAASLRKVPIPLSLPDSESVRLVRLSPDRPDGRWLAAILADGSARLWQAANGTVVSGFQANGPFNAAAFYYDDDDKVLNLALGGDVTQVWVIDADGQARLSSRIETGASVTQLIWSADGDLITGDEDGRVLAWETKSGPFTPLTPSVVTPLNVTTLGLEPTNTAVVNRLPDEAVLILTRNAPIIGLAEDDFGQWLAVSAAGSDEVHIFDVMQNTVEIVTLPEPVTTLLYRPGGSDAQQFLLGGERGTLQLWRISPEGHFLELRLNGHTDRITAMTFSLDSQYLATASQDGTVLVWYLASTEVGVPRIFSCDQTGATAAAFTDDQTTLVTGCADGEVRLWDRATGALLNVLPPQTGTITGLVYVPPGLRFAAAGEDGPLTIWSQGFNQSLTEHTSYVDGLVFISSSEADTARMLSASADGTVRLWTIPLDEGITNATSVSLPVASNEAPVYTQVAWLGERSWLAYQGQDGRVYVWALASGGRNQFTRVAVLPGRASGSGLYTLAFSPDGRWLATAGDNGELQLWAIADLIASPAPTTPTALLFYGPGQVGQLTFAHDSHTLAMHMTGTADGNVVVLWDTREATLSDGEGDVLALLTAENGFRAAAFSPIDDLLLTGNSLGQLQLWDTSPLPQNEPIDLGSLAEVHLSSITFMAFAPDGRQFATTDNGGVAHLWQMNSEAEAIQPEDFTFRRLSEGLAIYSEAFSQEGKWVALGLTNGQIQLQPLDYVATLLENACEQAQRNLSFSEWQDFFGPVFAGDQLFYKKTCDGLPIHGTVASELWLRSDLLAQQGALAEAIEVLTLAISLDSEETIPEYIAAAPEIYLEQITIDSLLSAGEALARQGNVAEALAKFTEATAINEDLVREEVLTEPQNYAWQLALEGLKNRTMLLSQPAEVERALALVREIAAAAPELLPEGIQADPERFVLMLAADYQLTQAGQVSQARAETYFVAAADYALQAQDAYLSYRVCTGGEMAGFAAAVSAVCEQVQALTQPLTVTQGGTGYLTLSSGEAWTFSVTADQPYALQIAPTLTDEGLTTLYPNLFVLDGDGVQLIDAFWESTTLGGISLSFTPTESATYTAFVLGYYESFGAYELHLLDAPLIEGQRQVNPLITEGVALAQVGNLSEAVARFDEALALNPQFVPALIRQDPTAYAQQLVRQYLVTTCFYTPEFSEPPPATVNCAELFDAAAALSFSQPITGVISSLETELWQITGEAGQTISITLTALPDSPLDSYLIIADAAGHILAEHDDIAPGENRNSAINIVLPESGVYFILARGFADSSGGYRLLVLSG